VLRSKHGHAETRVDVAVEVDAPFEHDLEFQARIVDEQSMSRDSRYSPNAIAS
jgi:hypothetical protein